MMSIREPVSRHDEGSFHRRDAKPDPKEATPRPRIYFWLFIALLCVAAFAGGWLVQWAIVNAPATAPRAVVEPPQLPSPSKAIEPVTVTEPVPSASAPSDATAVPPRPATSSIDFANRPRKRFVANQGRTEIAPGLVLFVNRVDTQRERFDGTLQSVSNGRALPLRDQSLLQSIRFADASDGPVDLIVTSLNETSVTGYVIFSGPRPDSK